MMRAVVVAGRAGVAACGGKPARTAAEAAPQRRAGRSPTRVPIEDDEPDDGVEIINARGHMEPAAVEAGLAPHTQRADRLLHDEGRPAALARRPRRAALGHQARRHGDARSSSPRATSARGRSRSACSRSRARRRSTSRIGGDADFTLPLEFSAQGQRADVGRGPGAARGRRPARQARRVRRARRRKGERRPTTSRSRSTSGRAARPQSVGFASTAPRSTTTWADVRGEGGDWRGGCPIRAGRSRSSRSGTARSGGADGLRADRGAAARPADRARLSPSACSRRRPRRATSAGEFPVAELRELGRARPARRRVPEELGGAGAGRGRVLAGDAGAGARRCVGRGRGVASRTWSAELIATHGTPERSAALGAAARVAASCVCGRVRAVSEPEAGSDPAAMRTTADEDGDAAGGSRAPSSGSPAAIARA